MPILTKFDSIVGRRTSSAKRPRSAGPSHRAVMTPFTMPMAIMANCPLSTWSELKAKLRRFGPLATSASRGRLRRHRIERVAACPEDRRACLRDELPPQPRPLRFVRTSRGLQPFLVDGDVGAAQPAHRLVERGHAVHRAIVDEPLLEIAEQHERPLDVVGVRNL